MIKEYLKHVVSWLFKPVRKKDVAEYPDLDKVYLYFNSVRHSLTEFFVDDQTAKDLNLDSVFLSVNHTCSKPGQQYLYSLLRFPPSEVKEKERLNERLDLIKINESVKLSIQKKLEKLNTWEDYYIISYLTNNATQTPGWFFITYLIQILLLSCFFFAFWYHLMVIPILFLFLLNLALHYKTKQEFTDFFTGLARISILHRIALSLSKELYLNQHEISKSLKSTKGILSKLWLFRTNNLQQSEFAQLLWLLIELIKVISLIEVQATYNISKKFEMYKPDFLALYTFIAEIDVAISIVEFRKYLPVYCIPDFLNDSAHIEFENVYHPLIVDCKPNSILLHNKSIFITGSNMSGKTTFLRTVGVNILLARSLNTCLAAKATLSVYNIFSSINISDQLEEDKSFYLAELSRLKYFVDISTQPKQYNLFLVDEILKGTNGYDRCQISAGILKYIGSNDKNTMLVTSHDSDLISRLEDEFKLYHFSEDVIDQQLVFDYELKEGPTKHSNAVKFLTLLQFPETIIKGVLPERV